MIVYRGDYGGLMEAEDAWALTFGATNTWSLVGSAIKPPRRALAVGVYDPVGDRMVIWGGRSGSRTYINDTWVLALGSQQWSQIFPAGGTPTGRESATAIYDPIEQQMVIFGGWNNSGNQTDPNVLNLGAPRWSPLFPSGTSAPSARWGHVAVYDPEGDRMVIFGGSALGGFSNDTWALSWVVRAGHEKVGSLAAPVVRVISPLAVLGVAAWPNPFHAATTLEFTLPAPGPTRLEVLDVTGRRVRVLVNGVLSAGVHRATWDGASDDRASLSPGVYVFRLEAPSGTLTRKVVRM